MYRLRWLALMAWSMVEIWILRKPMVALDGVGVSNFRAWHWLDTDVKYMFAHGYFTFLDLARLRFGFQTEMRRVIYKMRLLPVACAQVFSYKKPIRNGQKFAITTRVVFWNSKRFYLANEFVAGGEIYATGLIQCVFRNKAGLVKCDDVLIEAGMPDRLPEISAPMAKAIADLEAAAEA